MTTCRRVLLAAVLFGAAGMAGAQSQPKELLWAVSEFAGGGDWASRLPQLLIRHWGTFGDHRVTASETEAQRKTFLDQSLVSIDKEVSRLRLELDRKRLVGALPSSEPAATTKALADQEAKRVKTLAGLPEGQPPLSLKLKPVWSTGRESLPWPQMPRQELLEKSKALYVVTGSVRTVGTYLSVIIELYSALENKVLSSWEGQFAPEEAPGEMVKASDRFRTDLLGRPWSGLNLTSPVAGTQVFLGNQWHNLPWSTDDLSPGPLALKVRYPGGVEEVKALDLSPGSHLVLTLDTPEVSPDPIVLETVPPGVFLYLDSRYLGPSPQTVDRPLATTRIRAQSPGWATTAWEIGPDTVSPSQKTMEVPKPPASVPTAKDRFYLSLAAFSFSLTTAAFTGAWQEEQVKLTNAYATAGAILGYEAARDRYLLVTAGYAGSVALTMGVFVWMMFELGDYLGAAQASLP